MGRAGGKCRRVYSHLAPGEGVRTAFCEKIEKKGTCKKMKKKIEKAEKNSELIE